jgi:hypothetical protein
MNKVHGYLFGFVVGLIYLHPSHPLRGVDMEAYSAYGGQAHG